MIQSPAKPSEISPELALIDPELRVRLLRQLPEPDLFWGVQDRPMQIATPAPEAAAAITPAAPGTEPSRRRRTR